jgi:hypothetical protein
MALSPVARIALDAELAAASQPDLPTALAALIRAAIDAEADPYVTIGTLIEGVTHILAVSIPAERRVEVAVAALALLTDRMTARRVI